MPKAAGWVCVQPDMNPMQLPDGVDEELELLGELDAAGGTSSTSQTGQGATRQWGSGLMRK